MAASDDKLTPMKRQYNAIKSANPDCILFFRLGDFYEMFDEDARLAARELDLTIDPSVREYLVKKAFSVTYGARNLRREIQRSLEDPISEKIIESFEYPISSISISVENGAIKVEAQ